jgi:serine/threonine protein kinase
MIHTVPQRSDGQPRVHVTLIDFNLSFPLINGTTSSIGYTLGYTPPECYSGKWEYTFTVDSWSLGATLYLLFTGKTPYEYTYTEEGEKTPWPKKKRKEFMRNLLEHQQHSYAPLNCSSEARDFIEILLHVDPANRPTMRELMWHRWLK